MRILQVVNGYPHRAYGGVEIHTHQLCAALRTLDHQPFVFTRHSDPQATDGSVVKETVDGVPVWSVVNDFKRGRFRDHYLSTGVRTRFEEALREICPDVVHVQHLLGLSADLPEVSRASGVRTVASLHDYWHICQRAMLQDREGRHCGGPATASCVDCVLGGVLRQGVRAALRGRLPPLEWLPPLRQKRNEQRFETLRRSLLAYERIAVDSQYVVQEFARQAMPLPSDLASVLSLGLDTAPLIEVPPVGDLPIRPDRPLRIGFLGHLLPHKGPHILLEALRLLPGRPIRLSLHGRRWPDHPFDRKLARLLDMEPRAHHEGGFPSFALPTILRSIDVLVVPSTCAESFGLAAREALLAGRAVVTTDAGALPESVRQGRDGLIVQPGAPQALADALRRFFDEPELLETLLAGARSARREIKAMSVYAREIERELYR